MCTLILTPISRKSVSMSFFTSNNNIVIVIANLAPLAWNSITRFDANYLMFCLFGDTLSFMMCYTSFSSAALLLHNQTQSICATPNYFLNEETWNELDTRWPRDKIQDGGDLHDLFSSKSFHICAKKPQDIWVDRTFSKSKGKFFMEIILLSKYSWKRNRFSIVIVNICETRNEWLIRSYRLMSLMGMDWSDV